MLSFMRDQGAGNSSDHSSAGTGSPGAQSIGGPEAQEFLTVATNRKSLRRSTVVLAILVGVGLICLLFMIHQSQPGAAVAGQAGADEKKIDAAISRLTGVRSEMADSMDEIVQKFYDFSDVFQVKVGELVKNPFNVEGVVPELRGETLPMFDSQAQAELIRRRKMQQEASTLRLLSIMRSDKGHSCMINDQILCQGETIEGFMIVQIASNSVELTWLAGAADGNASETEQMKVTLKLSE